MNSRLFVHGDENKLRQVLINLLSNAVKFTDEGVVTLHITHHAKDQDIGRITYPSDRFTFHVSDTGIGISAEDLESIFEPFKRSQNERTDEGTGLGLAIAQKHVELMGGRIEVESEVGVGSRFFFTVPLKNPTQANTASKKEVSIVRLADGCNVKALVVDDVVENRDVLEQILTHIGVEVETAVDGIDALEKLESFSPDIAFIDIRMPRLSGLEMVQRILADGTLPRPKLVAFTASALLHQRQQYLDAGFDAFLPKPVESEKIYELLATLLRIEYKYESREERDDFTQIQISAELLKGLSEAIEFGELSEFEDRLAEVRQLGDAAESLADTLLTHCRNLDMVAISEILEQLHQ